MADALNSPIAWYALLVAAAVAGPYFCGVRPTTRRHHFYIALTLAFISWVLFFMAPLRSR